MLLLDSYLRFCYLTANALYFFFCIALNLSHLCLCLDIHAYTLALLLVSDHQLSPPLISLSYSKPPHT